MNATRLVVVVALALPAGWISGVLFDRIPPNEPLLSDLPGVRWRGPYGVLHVIVLGLFVAMAWRFDGASVGMLGYYLLLSLVLTTLSAIDLATLRLPDKLVVPSLLVAVPWVTVSSILDRHSEAARFAIAGGAIYFGFLLVAHLVFPRGMGFGDVKVAALLGLSAGWLATSYTESLVLVLYSALSGFVVGAFVGIVLLAFRRRSRPIPFGPFLAFGTLLTILAANQLLPAGL